jgi:monofunctional biosynthetic peptidoglycan transglycosylase
MIKKLSWLKWSAYITIAAITFSVVIYFYIRSNIPEVTYLRKNNPNTTALIEKRKEESKNAGRRFVLKQQWVRFQEIPDLLKKTIRISEDANFYFHDGIDLEELEEAFKKNFEKGRFARGGSTLTQQLAKNLFLSTDKSVWRKIKELFIAKNLEANLTKDRIFHIYLNIIEFGNGVFGVAAASRYFFYKPCSQLTTEEMIRLTAIIPKPLSVRPDRDSKWLLWRCRWITGKLLLYKYIDQDEHDRLLLYFNPQ